jgi:hypothetical protein
MLNCENRRQRSFKNIKNIFFLLFKEAGVVLKVNLLTNMSACIHIHAHERLVLVNALSIF